MAQRKVLDICDDGIHLVCVKDEECRNNPYKLYKVWWDHGRHRKQIAAYQDFTSVLYHTYSLTLKGGGTVLT